MDHLLTRALSFDPSPTLCTQVTAPSTFSMLVGTQKYRHQRRAMTLVDVTHMKKRKKK